MSDTTTFWCGGCDSGEATTGFYSGELLFSVIELFLMLQLTLSRIRSFPNETDRSITSMGVNLIKFFLLDLYIHSSFRPNL